MAKKKKSVELLERNIMFELNSQSFKLLRYYPSTMNLDLMEYDKNGIKIGLKSIPFAQLPKGIKKLIKPN